MEQGNGKYEISSKVWKQIEHYFGDANLNFDTFMKKEMEKDDGYVEFKVLARFNKIKQIVDAGLSKQEDEQTKDETSDESKKMDKISEVLGEIVCKEIADHPKLEVNEEMTKIRRVEKFVENQGWYGRTIHVKYVNRQEGTRREAIGEIEEYLNGLIGGEEECVKLTRARKFLNRGGMSRNNNRRGGMGGGNKPEFRGSYLVEIGTDKQVEEIFEKLAKDNSVEGEEQGDIQVEIKGHKCLIDRLENYVNKKIKNDEYIPMELRNPASVYVNPVGNAGGRDKNKRKTDEGGDGKTNRVTVSNDGDNVELLKFQVIYNNQNAENGEENGQELEKKVDYKAIKKVFGGSEELQEQYGKIRFIDLENNIIRFAKGVPSETVEKIRSVGEGADNVEIKIDENTGIRLNLLTEQQFEQFKEKLLNDLSRNKDKNAHHNRFVHNKRPRN